MRPLPSSILQKINQSIQTRDNNSEFKNDIWINRPSTELVNERFIEGPIDISDENNIIDFDIAVAHPFRDHNDTALWQCYITEDAQGVKELKIIEYSLAHKFDSSLRRTEYPNPLENSSEPVKCSIAFNSSIVRNSSGHLQFITEEYPWIFIVYENGELIAKQINSDRPADTLIGSGCTDVSSVRAMSSTNGGVDYGLICFFIYDGTIHYRQYAQRKWGDLRYIELLTEYNWIEIASFRTWDYRVGLHAKNSAGDVYEIFTQYMGLGELNSENITTEVDPVNEITEINHREIPNHEHITASLNPMSSVGYALSAIPLSAENIDYFEIGEWGTIVRVVFDHVQHIVPETDGAMSVWKWFSLTDTLGHRYTCSNAIPGEDGQLGSEGTELYLFFTDFNFSWNAEHMTITYAPYNGGGLQSDIVMTDAFSIDFIPTHLRDPGIAPPVVTDIWNE